MARIDVPKNPDELIALAKGILAKHTADGANSPLAGLNMADFTAKTTAADTKNQLAAKLYRDAEAATADRKLASGEDNPQSGTVTQYVRSVRDILMGLNKGNEQKLGDWHFTVDTSVPPAKKTVKPA